MTTDSQKISTVDRWLKKPNFRKLFDREYQDFLASEKLAHSTVFEELREDAKRKG